MRSLDGGLVSERLSEAQARALMGQLEKLSNADVSSLDSGYIGEKLTFSPE